jgi:hypothetical protein
VAVVDFDADYAMLNKIFATDYAGAGRYSPPKCIGAVKQTIMGNPDPDLINTSFAERQNLTMRMSMRRFTRLTNAFSKKFENHCHALALYFVFYNFCRVHKTLGATPAMAAGLVDKVLKMADVVGMIDARKPMLSVALIRKRPLKFQTETLPIAGTDRFQTPYAGRPADRSRRNQLGYAKSNGEVAQPPRQLVMR